MSGVVALCDRSGAPVDPTLLSDMTAAMAFRGPDAQHTWYDGAIGLGHTQLSTTFEAAHESQPCSLDGQVWIVADARLDGRGTLLDSLRQQYPIPPDSTDVELILHAYAVWGERCIDHLSGDFAFALWDGRLHRLFCARDHFGVAQLFYRQTDTLLIVGNTLPALLLHPEVPDRLDEQALADVALFGMYLDPEATAYEAVRRLPQGHKLTWDTDGLMVERFWRPLESPEYLRYRHPADYVEHFRECFDAAVADRLRTDHAGTHLSGGMDSTSIAVTAHQLLKDSGRPYRFHAYTMVYERLIPDDEGLYAEQVAKQSGFALEYVVSEQVMQMAPPASPAWVPAEPGPTYVPGWHDITLSVSKFARVLLAGFGGDPVCYPAAFSWQAAWASVAQKQWLWPLRGILRRWKDQSRQQPDLSLPPWVNRQFAGRLELQARLDKWRALAQRERLGMLHAPLWRAIFAWSDPGYTGLPLRNRFPFFDRRLWDYLRQVPPAPWLEDKHLLRAAMCGRLPEAVLTRAKTTLRGQPLQAWLMETGVPAWELEAIAAPEMQSYIEPRWLEYVTSLPPAQRSEVWANDRPPLALAHWLRYRKQPQRSLHT